MDDEQRRLVREVRRVHGPDDGHIVDVFRRVRQKLGNFYPGFAVPGEFEWRRHQATGFANGPDLGREVAAGWLAGILLERGLVIEQVDLAGTAIHEELNDRFGLVRVMGRLRFQIISGGQSSGQRRIGAEQIIPKQISQRRAVQAVRYGPEESAPGCSGSGINPHRETPLS